MVALPGKYRAFYCSILLETDNCDDLRSEETDKYDLLCGETLQSAEIR